MFDGNIVGKEEIFTFEKHLFKVLKNDKVIHKIYSHINVNSMGKIMHTAHTQMSLEMNERLRNYIFNTIMQ